MGRTSSLIGTPAQAVVDYRTLIDAGMQYFIAFLFGNDLETPRLPHGAGRTQTPDTLRRHSKRPPLLAKTGFSFHYYSTPRSRRVVSSGSKAVRPSDRHAAVGGGVAWCGVEWRGVRRAAHVPCWCESSQTVLRAGSDAK